MNEYHTPVLLQEVVIGLDVKPNGRYIDATVGGGGHAARILELGGNVLGLDHDQEALDYLTRKFSHHQHIILTKANFKDLTQIADLHGFDHVDGILFDLGVSSWQLTQPHRGFTFTGESPLDMRMDQDLGVTARDLLAALSQKELTKLFQLYSDEPHAAQIARAIATERKRQPIITGSQLANIVQMHSRKSASTHLHPSTKVFQALRIAVNDELNNLQLALPQASALLKPGGRLVVISFHSGEDRIVKQFIKLATNLFSLYQKPITPSKSEIKKNPRSRSAKLRIATKVH